MNLKFASLGLLFLSSLVTSSQNLPWPVSPRNQQNIITGTVGEYRNTDRFHRGSDIISINGSVGVFTIEDGIVNAIAGDGTSNERIRIDDVWYYHVDVDESLEIGDQVYASLPNGPTYLGDFTTVLANRHVHLADGDRNFLSGNLSPYADNIIPVIHNIQFRRNGHRLYNSSTAFAQSVGFNGQDRHLIFGMADVVVRASDPGVSYTYAPYSITYTLTNGASQLVTNNNNFIFEDLPLDAAAATSFGPGTTFAPAVYYYVLTNHPRTAPYDRYWNTLLRNTEDPDLWTTTNQPNIDARHPLESYYSDGVYNFNFSVTDVDYSNNPAKEVTELRTVIVDNFRPIISKVVIREGNQTIGDVIYSGEWEWGGTQLEFNSNPISNSIGTPLWIIVKTSERMKELTLQTPWDGITYNYTEASANYKEFKFYISGGVPTTEIGVPQTLIFEGLDLSGNKLDSNPQSVAIRSGSGTNEWTTGTDPGNDTNHTFNTGASCTPGGVAPPGDETVMAMVSGSCTYADIEVTKQNPAVGEAVIFKAIIGPYTTLSWNFGSGATADNTNQEEATVFYTSGGSKIITLSVDGELFSFSGFIDVGAQNPPITFNVNKTATYLALDQNVTYSISGLSGSQGAVSYQWDFGDGANYSSSTTSSVMVSYFTEGQKTVRVTVCDDVQCLTSSKNDFVRVSGYASNDVIQASIAGTCSGGYDGAISLTGSYFKGDNISDNETFYWDLGDGTYKSGSSISHNYKSPGYYTISLTVCDDSGCATDYCSVNFDEFDFPAVTVPNFTINGEQAVYWQFNSTGCEDDYYYPSTRFVTSGLAITLNDASKVLSGSPISGGYYEIIPESGVCLGGCPILNGEGPHQLSLSGEDGDLWLIRYKKSGANCNNNPLEVNAYVEISSSASDIGRCWAEVTNFSLGHSCWDGTNIPINVTIGNSNCDYDYISVTDLSTNNLIASGNGALNWTSSQMPSELPYETQLRVDVHYDCGDGTGCSTIESKTYDVSLNSPPDFEVPTNLNICKGASTGIGMDLVSGYSYVWTGTNTNYLSATNISNPVFTGMNTGTHNYTLTITNLVTGCHSQENAVITVGNIKNRNYSINTKAGASSFALNAPFEGDGRSYEYQWSPATFLDNPRVPNPVFTPPLTGQTVVYSVTASFRDCSAVGNVNVEVENDPPSDLTVAIDPFGYPDLSWSDNSVENYFVIERSADGGGTWEYLGKSNSNDASYLNFQCLLGGEEYCYRVKAYDINNNYIGTSNPYCFVIPIRPKEILTLPHSTTTLNMISKKSIFDYNKGFGGAISGNLSFVGRSGDLLSADFYTRPSDLTKGIAITNWTSQTTQLFSLSEDFYPNVSYNILYQNKECYSIGGAKIVDSKQLMHGKLLYADGTRTDLNFTGFWGVEKPIELSSPVYSFSSGGNIFFIASGVIKSDDKSIFLFKINSSGAMTRKVIENDTWEMNILDAKIYNGKIWIVYIHRTFTDDRLMLKTLSTDFSQETNKILLNNADFDYGKMEFSPLDGSMYFFTDQKLFKLSGNQVTSVNIPLYRPKCILTYNSGFLIHGSSSVGGEVFEGFYMYDFEGSQMNFTSARKALSYIIGGVNHGNTIVMDYVGIGTSGPTYSVIYDRFNIPEEGLSICESNLRDQNETFFARNAIIAGTCNVSVANDQFLKAYAENSIILKPGFHALPGSKVHIKANVSASCDDNNLTYRLTEGIEQIIEIDDKKAFLNLYPNPTSDRVVVHFNGDLSTGAVLDIVNMEGIVVFTTDQISKSSNEISVAALPKGIYIIRLETFEGIKAQKLIVK